MSRNFSSLPNRPYIGVPFSSPIAICDPLKNPPVILPFPIQWISYGASSATPNVSITLNVKQSGQKAIIDRVRSVYIDNLGNNVPVYVYFPSTNYTVACQPNAQGWFTVMSNDLVAIVAGEGFTDADTLAATTPAETFVGLCNSPVQPANNVELAQTISLFRASPTIQRGNTIYNSNFAPAALGDQSASANIAAPLTQPQTVGLWGTPYASGFIYLTGIQLQANNYSNSGGVDTLTAFVESTGVSGILYTLNWSVTSLVVSTTLINRSSMNLKLDATQTWRVRRIGSSAATGFLSLSSEFTYQTS